MFSKLRVRFLEGGRGEDALALGDSLSPATGTPMEVVNVVTSEHHVELAVAR